MFLRSQAAADRLRAVRLGVRDALREHALLGRSVTVLRDGRIVELTPAEILDELERQPDPDAASRGKTTND
jgi:hypothetical protein